MIMAMSKKDFEAMALAMAEAKRDAQYDNPDATPEETEAAMRALELASRRLAAACAGQYKGGYGFNRTRFLEWCGFPVAHSN
jgi:hypothetical protein